jgi:hypothetical protein
VEIRVGSVSGCAAVHRGRVDSPNLLGALLVPPLSHTSVPECRVPTLSLPSEDGRLSVVFPRWQLGSRTTVLLMELLTTRVLCKGQPFGAVSSVCGLPPSVTHLIVPAAFSQGVPSRCAYMLNTPCSFASQRGREMSRGHLASKSCHPCAGPRTRTWPCIDQCSVEQCG